MIPDTATELAYFHAYRAVPRLVRVVRFTPTTVFVDASRYPFHRSSGRQKGGVAYGGHVELVTPEILDHIAASQRQERIGELRDRVRSAFAAKAQKRIAASIAMHHETKLIAAESTIDKLEALLAEAEAP